ncbi:stabilizer of axonemal microtubules 1-like [Antedon mediterranea]|uniref:stabilizer of axonemal microtubules 1-like n=1 Tax=Antedon mediterranea TaxID=105859 RepID=UPI003AF75866
MGRQCICEICTCGRHRCPHQPKAPKTFGPCEISEYNNKYKAYNVTGRRDNFKPKQEVMQGGEPMADSTTHKSDFIPHQAEKPMMHVPDAYQPIPGDIDTLTSYTKDYPAKRSEMPKSFKATDHKMAPAGEFKGTPTYTDDYRRWKLPKRENDRGLAIYVPPSAPFEGSSTFTRDFQPKRAEMARSMKPVEQSRTSDQPFDDNTMHKSAYVAYPAQPKYVRPKQLYAKNPNKFDDMTTFRRDYPGKYVSVVNSFKPDMTPIKSDQPFDDNTTFKQDFKKWDVTPPHVKVPDGYVRPAGNMDLNTTSKIAFPAHALQERKLWKPTQRAQTNDVPFDGRTSYKQDFLKWDPKRERRGNPNQKAYERPNVPFEGSTNYQSHYIPKKVSALKAAGPDRTAHVSSDPFDDRTMYNAEYLPKAREMCPAINLGASGYQFGEVDQRGHQVWKKENGGYERTFKSPVQRISMEYSVA